MDLNKIRPRSAIETRNPEDIVDYGMSLDEKENLVRSHDLDVLRHDLNSKKRMLGLGTAYSFALFVLISIWLLYIACIIFLAGINTFPAIRFHLLFLRIHTAKMSFKLSDPVLIALISTTTINVLGLFLTAAHWLFPPKAKADEKAAAEKPPLK